MITTTTMISISVKPRDRGKLASDMGQIIAPQDDHFGPRGPL
jgi:hypothetical protein